MTKSSFFKISMEHSITLILIALLLSSLALSVFFFDIMPSKMATHFNMDGTPNGFSSKTIGLFIFPAIIGLLIAVFNLVPNIDPLKKNIMKFQKQFGIFIILLTSFFIIIQAQLIAWNKGIQTNSQIIIFIALGLIIFYVGTLLKKTKRNFFIGIRTPWTLNSDYVWEKTHNLGSVLFKLSGTIIILGIILKIFSIWVILSPIILSAIILIIHSYILYTKEENKKLKSKQSKKGNKK